MAKSIRISAHRCVVSRELKNAEPSMGDRYGRMIPRLPPCEVDETATVALWRSALRMDATLPVGDEGLGGLARPARRRSRFVQEHGSSLVTQASRREGRRLHAG